LTQSNEVRLGPARRKQNDARSQQTDCRPRYVPAIRPITLNEPKPRYRSHDVDTSIGRISPASCWAFDEGQQIREQSQRHHSRRQPPSRSIKSKPRPEREAPCDLSDRCSCICTKCQHETQRATTEPMPSIPASGQKILDGGTETSWHQLSSFQRTLVFFVELTRYRLSDGTSLAMRANRWQWEPQGLYRSITITPLSRPPGRLVLVVLVMLAVLASLMHAHASYACRAPNDPVVSGDMAASQAHRDGPTQDAPEPSNGSLDSCVHHTPSVSASSAAPVIDSYRFAPRIVIPDDLVVDLRPASRLERPPRDLLST
jgi:hypothetical protein